MKIDCYGFIRVLFFALIALVGVPSQAGVNTGLSGDDRSAGPFPIGFNFSYFGNTYTQFYVSTNGLIGFTGGSTSYGNSCSPGLSNTLFVFWDDLRTDVAGQPEGKIEYETIGEAPNRKLIVQWTNQYFFGDNVPMGTFQAILSEGSDEIKYQYRNLIQDRSKGGSATVAIRGASDSQFNLVSCETPFSIAEGQAVLFTPDETRTSYVVSSDSPYAFLDISGLTPLAPVPVKNFSNDSITWNWTKIPSLNDYEIYIETVEGDFIYSEILGDVNSYTISSNLVHGKSYIAKIRGSINSGSTWELWSGFSSSTLIDNVVPEANLQSFSQTGANTFDLEFGAVDDLSGIASQRLQLSLDVNFSDFLFDEMIPANLSKYEFNGGQAGQHIYARLIAKDMAGNQSVSAIRELDVLPPPVADFESSTEATEAPLNVMFLNKSQGSISAYSWDFGNGKTSSQISPSALYILPGTYTVKLEVSGPSGSDDVTKIITVTPDITPPVINFAQFKSGASFLDLESAPILTSSGRFSINAADASKISRMVFSLDNNIVGNVVITDAQGFYDQPLDILALDDGIHTLDLDVYDTLDNLVHKTYSFTVEAAAPLVPSIDIPTQDSQLNKRYVMLQGRSAKNTEVVIANNGSDVLADVPVESNGSFSAYVDLDEGLNLISVKARFLGRDKWSSYSADRKIVVNTQIPDAPQSIAAVALKQGQINVSWAEVKSSDVNNQVKGYNLYRSSQAFQSPQDAGVSKINTQLLAVSTYTDMAVNDGQCFYAVTSVNQANNESELSAIASAVADSTGPQIAHLNFVSDGIYDGSTHRWGKGNIQVQAEFSEPLRNAPYFAIAPENGLPITVQLSKDYTNPLLYKGSFAIAANAPSGTAYAVMSANDEVGNRGTEILENNSLIIDTKGPELSDLQVTPAEPIKVDETSGVIVQISANLSESVKPGTSPQLVPLVDGVGVAGYEEGIQWQSETNGVYVGTFNLPATAAQSGVGVLSFTYSAVDDMDNLSAKINGQNQFQIYQGNLPPLNTPNGLIVKAQPGGHVSLTWSAVENAVAYVLYRQGPSDSEPQELQRLSATTYDDLPDVDGIYLYSVASVRQGNGQESVSAASGSVSVKVDRVPPAAPEEFSLELNGAGMVSRWVAPALDLNGNPQDTLGLTYNLYRLDLPQGQQANSTAGLTALQTKIPEPIALDPEPSDTEHSYFVTAVDAAGNESVPSSTAYLNSGLLPVSQLTLVLGDSSYPQITWKHAGSGIVGYRVYRYNGEGEMALLTPETIPHTAATTQFTDASYNAGIASQGASQEVIYSVVAVDANNVESAAHELTLPALKASVVSDDSVGLERGVFNQLMVRVDNLGATDAKHIKLYVDITVDGQVKTHQSEYFDLAAGANSIVPIVIGGYAKLDALTAIKLRTEQVPQSGEKVQIEQIQNVTVGSAALTSELNTQDVTRGGAAKVSFTLTNTSKVETEVVLALANGSKDSDEVRLILEDLQGNLLAQQTIRQTTGNVINVPSGHTVARIAPGESFTSNEFTINVPAAAPEKVRLKLVVDKYHYHQGKADQVAIEGVGLNKELQLIDTPYYAELTSVSPGVVDAKTGLVAISGAVKNRTSLQSVANVPVLVAISVRGFERTYIVYSDESGNFTYNYKLDGVAGSYKVSVVHPEITDRPAQGSFIAEGASVSPSDIRIKVPKNYTQKFPVKVTAGDATALNNIHLTLVANGTEETPQLPSGITISSNVLASLLANKSENINVGFSGDNSADTSGLISYLVEADGHLGANALGRININYELSEAAPAVVTKPSYIETGVTLEGSVLEDLAVSNNGLDLLRNAKIALVGKDGAEVPNWVSLTTEPTLGDIPVGESRNVQISATPDLTVQEGIYELRLNITGDNLSDYALPVFIKVTQSGIGSAAFKVTDIYTATLDENNQLIYGVNNAKIQLQNENVLSEVYSLNTDANGDAVFDGIPAGRYAYRATAFDHDSISGRIWIKPGVTASENVFLMNSLVNVEWSVKEITIEDRYEIKLEATFKTHVPVALVMIDPLHVNLPVMKKGEVFQGELTLTNYGLINAENVRQVLPQNSDLVKFEFLRAVPEVLTAGEVFTLPYKIQALRDFNPESSADATGGGCGSYSGATQVTYESKCAAGNIVPNQASTSWGANWGSCTSGSSGTITYIPPGVGGRTEGGGGWGYGSIGEPIGGSASPCQSDDPNQDDCNAGNGSGH